MQQAATTEVRLSCPYCKTVQVDGLLEGNVDSCCGHGADRVLSISGEDRIFALIALSKVDVENAEKLETRISVRHVQHVLTD